MLFRFDNDGKKFMNWATAYSSIWSARAVPPAAEAASPDRRRGSPLPPLEYRATPATLHWLGTTGGSGNLWGFAGDWLENRVPPGGDQLTFDTGTPGYSPSVNGLAPTNDVAGLRNLTLGVNDSSPAGDFAIGGNAVGLVTAAGVGVTSTVAVGKELVVNNLLTLGTDTSSNAALGTLTVGGAVGGKFALTAAGSTAGTVNLNVSNTYSAA